MNSKIVFDRKQMDKLAALFKKPHTANWTTDNLLKLIQALGLLAAACWAIFQYVTFQEKANAIALEQQRLSVQQAQIALRTQDESNEASLKQQRLAVELAQINLKTQGEFNETALKKQQLDIRQSEVSLATQRNQKELRNQELVNTVELKRQEIELNRLQQKIQQNEVENRTSYKFAKTFILKARKLKDETDGTALYTIALDFTLTNKSTVSIENSFWIHDYFIGTPKEPSKVTDINAYISPLGAPPNRWNSSSGKNGAIQWQLIGSWGAISYDASNAVGEVASYLARSTRLINNGGGVGIWRPDEVMSFGEEYILRAPPKAYFGMTINIAFNRLKDIQFDSYQINRYLQLPDNDSEVESR